MEERGLKDECWHELKAVIIGTLALPALIIMARTQGGTWIQRVAALVLGLVILHLWFRAFVRWQRLRKQIKAIRQNSGE